MPADKWDIEITVQITKDGQQSLAAPGQGKEEVQHRAHGPAPRQWGAWAAGHSDWAERRGGQGEL